MSDLLVGPVVQACTNFVICACSDPVKANGGTEVQSPDGLVLVEVIVPSALRHVPPLDLHEDILDGCGCD
jgi:hypothetical protein